MEVLLQYKEIILIGLSFILEILVFLLFKKRNQVIDNGLISKLCYWILEAERTYKQGGDKMKFVLKEAEKYLGDKFVEVDVRKMVEYLLTVPEKKEK